MPRPTDMLANKEARLVGSVTEADVIPEESRYMKPTTVPNMPRANICSDKNQQASTSLLVYCFVYAI